MSLSLLGLHSEYLIVSIPHTKATGLEKATDGSINHDKVTRFLSEEDFTSLKSQFGGITKFPVTLLYR
jgi:hypothetical protein